LKSGAFGGIYLVCTAQQHPKKKLNGMGGMSMRLPDYGKLDFNRLLLARESYHKNGLLKGSGNS
jgi:hypothetical protein